MHDEEMKHALRELAHAEADDDALRSAEATAPQQVHSRRRLARIRSHVDQLRTLNRRLPPS